jgi:CRP/FNR family transcriptional regulator, anaerobic regulatory protein
MPMTAHDLKNSSCSICPVRESSLCHSIVPHSLGNEFGVLPRTQRGARARELVYTKGRRTDDVLILCYGVAFSFNSLPNGRRKIHSFLLSGDPISVTSIFRDELPYSVEALTDVRFSLFQRSDLMALLAPNAKLLPALARSCVEEENETREQLIDLALRSAQERIARLILRLTERMRTRQVIKDNRYPFPFRQQDIAEFVGLSLAHVNRVVSDLRRSGLIELAQGTLTVSDYDALKAIGEFG